MEVEQVTPGVPVSTDALLREGEEHRKIDRIWSYTFSYLFGALLLGSLIYFSGVWNFLANTRLLSVLINMGIVSYNDAQQGFIKGVPDLKYFLKSQDPVKWGLVELSALIFLFFWLIKALQFHGLARFCGVKGTFTQHARAYLEGVGINRLVPFNMGNTWMARMLAGQGAPLNSLAQAIFLTELFVVFEIIVYAAYGPFALGWSVWLAQIFWSLVILGVCWAIARPSRAFPDRSILQGSWTETRTMIRALARHPRQLAGFCLLSLIAFGLEDIAAYVIAMAFTSTHVILNVNFSVLLMAIVGGYIARLIPLAPGGIGQYEWGFAAGLYLGGVGFPECVTIGILDNLIRYISGSLLLAWVYILRVDYSFEVLKRVDPKTPNV
ncbi:MAG: lysylphosphatidylglycerol synthase transmembrane domain-containing protein [Acidobacteriota bacterium]